MSEIKHTPTPWRAFKNKDGTRLVGIGGQDGQGILDAGFGVWSWDDPEGIANADLVVKAVNNHEALVEALLSVVCDVDDYQMANNLAPNPGRTECWDSMARAKAVLAVVKGEV